MGNQQPTGRTRSDTYTRYERDGEDGRYVTLDQTDSGGNSHLSSFDERVIKIKKSSHIFFHSIVFRLDQDMIQVYQFVFVINVKCNNIRHNKLFKPKCKMKKKQSRWFLNIPLHQKIKKLY